MSTIQKFTRFSGFAAILFVIGCAGNQNVSQTSSEETAAQKTEVVETKSSESIQGANHSDLKAVYWYQQAAESRALYHQGYNLAELKLKEYIDTMSPVKPLAVVLDVDESVLDNSPYQGSVIREGVAYPEGWAEWVNKREATLLPGVKEFLMYAAEEKVHVFYITNRRDNLKQATIDNLSKYNLPNADAAHVITRGKTSDKTQRRKQVLLDYEIALFIGDNLGDFDEVFQGKPSKERSNAVDEYQSMFGSKFIMLPNSMYGEWESAAYEYNYDRTRTEKNALMYEKLNDAELKGDESTDSDTAQ